MRPRRLAAIVLIAVAPLAGCGSSNDAGTASTASVDGAVVDVGAAPAPPPSGGAGSIGDAVEVAAGALGNADVAACTTDQQTLQAAVEAYELLNGALPTGQQDLVDTQLLREASVRFEISPEGDVVASPGSPCS
jgi:hypothetical protein